MLKQTNRGEDDLGQTSALVRVYQAAFPDHLLCARHCAGFVGDVAGITATAQSSFPPVVSKDTPLMLLPSLQNADAVGSLGVTATVGVVMTQQNKQDATHSQG